MFRSKNSEPKSRFWQRGETQHKNGSGGEPEALSAKLEFTQIYDKNRKVIKRGINASPAEVRRQGMTSDCFQTYVAQISRRTAFTAFHFHPNYPKDKREALMIANREGLDALMRPGPTWEMHRSGSFAADQVRDLILGFAETLKRKGIWGARRTAD